MLSKQQTAISSLTDTIKSLQDEIRGKNAADAPVAIIASKQVKAEAARIKVTFSEQEATLKLQKSQIEEKKAAAFADRQKQIYI